MPYQFRGQHRNEEVLAICRRHPFVLLRPMLAAVLVVLVPLLVDVFVPTGVVLAVAVLACLVVGISVGLVGWYSWNNSLFLLTNERVVLLVQKGLLAREFIEVGLANIQQVSHGVKGLWATLMGYGTLTLSSGGSQQPLLIRDMPDPYELQQEIQAAVAGEVAE